MSSVIFDFKATDNYTITIKNMGKSTDEFTEKVHKSHSALETFAKLEIGKLAMEGAEKIYEWAKSFVEFAVEVNEARNAQLRFLETTEGSKGLAEEEREKQVAWAKQTGQSIDDVITQRKKLEGFERQYGSEAVHRAQEVAADVKASRGDEGANALIESLAKITDKAKLSARSFDGLKAAGITAREVGDTFAKELGIKGPHAAEQGLKKLFDMSDGRAKAESLILQTLSDKYSGVAGSGTAALEKSAGSVTDAWNEVKISF